MAGSFPARTQATTISLLIVTLLSFAAPAQSLWKDETSKPMFADKRASAVGDLLTIIIKENSSSSKDNKTTTKKNSSVDASIASFLYSPAASGLLTKGGQMPALKYAMENKHDGGGTIGNTENIDAKATVRVVDVLPNKTLVVEGRRETSFSGERQSIILRGLVRSEDVSANNTVFSYNLADARVEILSNGSITDTQKKGWFTRLWEKFTPF